MIGYYFILIEFWLCVSFISCQGYSKGNGDTATRDIEPRSDIQSPRICQTPSKNRGLCIPVRHCKVLWDAKNWRLIRQSFCGMKDESPKVCCPITESNSTTTIETVTSARTQSSTKSSKSPGTMPALSSLISSANSTVISLQPSSTKLSPISPPSRARKRQNLNLFPQECGRTNSPFRRIIGGQEAAVGAWPWMAVLYLTRRGLKSAECGGVLITNRHVITAAHCTVNSRRGTAISPSIMLIRLADHDLESEDEGTDPIEVTVKSVIKHENFNIRNFQNDIAILELTLAIDIRDDLKPICLPFDVFSSDDLSEKNAFAAGWGTISFGGPASPKLQEVQLRIWENSNCEEIFKKDVPITDANLCAGGDGDKDACRGDSGGPLMLPHSNSRFYLIGIVSFGRKCAEPGVPGVFARVTSFLDWIEDHIEPET